MLRYEGLPVLIKRILLFLIVLLFAALQNTDGLLPCIFGARFFILIPLTVAIGMYEGEIAGLLYGTAAGAFWDVCSAGLDGIHTLSLALIGCASGLLIHFFMRNKLLSQYCICAVSCVLHAVLYWAVSVYIPVGDSGGAKLLGFYLPCAVITTAISFVIYYFIRFISTTLKEKEEKT